jgi:type I restriction enzyme S subunit
MTRAYPAYRDSGVEWLGRVPAHWEVIKLARAVPDISSGTTPLSQNPKYYDDGDISWVNTGDLNDSDLLDCKRQVTAAAIDEHSALKVYPAGSVIIAMYGATIGKLSLVHFPACVNQACCVFGVSPIIHQKFLFFWLLGFRARIISMASGGGQPNISQDILRNLRLSLPPLPEQQAIAAFLDREVGKIDGLVEEQRRLIALLAEKRRAVISHAVTRGLNPAAPLKPSGVDWLGNIPAHWAVGKLGYYSKLQSGFAFPSEAFGSDGVAVVKMTNLDRGRADLSDAARIPESDALLRVALRENDLVWGMSGSVGETGSLGNFARISVDDLPCQLNQRVGRFLNMINTLSLDFLEIIIQARYFKEQILLWVTGTAQFNISSEQVESCKIAVPPQDEQAGIVRHLKEKLVGFDALSAEADRAVALLLERRAALISAAVTGKIDVRALARDTEAA